MNPPAGRADITGLILAGGRGSRMGGADKGLVPFRGSRLIDHVIARLRPQVGNVMISANRNLGTYAALGARVIADDRPGHPGPLAGIAAALHACPTPWLLTVPCDVPDFPADLGQRLTQALQMSQPAPDKTAQPPMLALATVGQADAPSARLEPAFMLVHRDLRASIEHDLDQGLRAITAWAARAGFVTAGFDEPQAFANANTEQQLRELE